MPRSYSQVLPMESISGRAMLPAELSGEMQTAHVTAVFENTWV